MSKRKINRIARKWPLFAKEFCDDIGLDTSSIIFEEIAPVKKKKKGNKAKIKALKRHGRFSEIDRLLREYAITGNTEYLFKAQTLRNRLTKPYLLRIKKENFVFVLCIDSTIGFETIKSLLSVKGSGADYNAHLIQLARYGTLKGYKEIYFAKALFYEGPIYETENCMK